MTMIADVGTSSSGPRWASLTGLPIRRLQWGVYFLVSTKISDTICQLSAVVCPPSKDAATAADATAADAAAADDAAETDAAATDAAAANAATATVSWLSSS